jgi:hypothetical protein
MQNTSTAACGDVEGSSGDAMQDTALGRRFARAEQKQGETRLVLRRSSQLESANNSNLHVIRIDCTLPPALLSSIPRAIQLPELHDVYSGWNLANMRALRQFGTRLGPRSGVAHGVDVWMWHSLIALHHACLNHSFIAARARCYVDPALAFRLQSLQSLQSLSHTSSFQTRNRLTRVIASRQAGMIMATSLSQTLRSCDTEVISLASLGQGQ